MGVTIASILINNPKTRFVFHVFTFSILDDNLNRLKDIETQHGVRICVHIIDMKRFGDYAKFPSFAQYSAAIFTRLLIPQILSGITKRVLYLDSDILCLGSINDLILMDISDSIVAVVGDCGEETVRNQCSKLKLKANRYFNSGFLYINIEKWLQKEITDQAIKEILCSNHKFMFPDQDALNIVLDGQAKFIDEKWNFQYNLENSIREGIYEISDDLSNTIFIHFTGRVKHWHGWSLHKACDLFLKYQSNSPWAGIALDPPKNYKEMRLFSRFLMHQGRIKSAVYWYMKYLTSKFLTKSSYKAS
jgi:UDP-glucose:(glucosyl)LPS alpha-1,3-glucosyltransferase